MQPDFPTNFQPRPAELFDHKGRFVARVDVIGLERYRSYDVENERHYYRAMAMLSIGTIAGLHRVRFL